MRVTVRIRDPLKVLRALYVVWDRDVNKSQGIVLQYDFEMSALDK